MTLDPEDLKPCPFCGSAATLHRSERPGGYGYHLHWVACSNFDDGCAVQTQDRRFPDQAIAAWDRRVAEAALQAAEARADGAEAENKRLREALEPGSLEGDDSAPLMVFMNTLHEHLPEDERPTAWMQFTDEQRDRIKRAYTALARSALSPPEGVDRVEEGKADA